MNVLKYKNDCLTIARDISGMDSGNLRYNATTAINVINGFAIKVSGLQANYWVYLDKGTRYSTKHKGYINEIKNQISLYINDKGNSKYNNITATAKNVNRYSRDTLQRQRVNQRSLEFNRRSLGGV